jgi:glycosyltransferase involved in cell wall biosynthesis
MTSKPKITLVIPTRERGDVLQSTLRTAVAQDYDNLEILVADNFSNDNTRDIVMSQADKRIRYVNSGKRLNMSSNWDFALSNLGKTDFVSIMGDDDGILPRSISRMAEVLSETGVRALRARSYDYHWPKRNAKPHGRLSVEKMSGGEVRDGLVWLKKVLVKGMPYSNLPVIYNGGIVQIDELQKLKRDGRYFCSPIPDVFSGVALASTIGRYAFLNEPLFINGASQHSIGTSQFLEAAKIGSVSNKTPAQVFLDEANIPFHPSLPMAHDGGYPKSTRIMVYDAYLKSAFLRIGGELTTSQQQLAQVLAGRGKTSRRNEILGWAEDFARFNNLSMTKGRFDAIFIKLFSAPTRHWQKKNTIRTRKVFDNPIYPLKDVSEACTFIESRSFLF